MDVAFADDQMPARTQHTVHNLAILRHLTLNLIRLDLIKRKGGIKARSFVAATSDAYRERLLGLVWRSCDLPALAICVLLPKWLRNYDATTHQFEPKFPVTPHF